MPSEDRDIIDKIGRTLVVALLVYLASFALLLGIGSFGASIHPLIAIFLGFFVVYAGFTIYYYRNPREVEK